MTQPKKAPTSGPKAHKLGLEDLKALIGLVAKEAIQEFEFESGSVRFRIRKDAPGAVPVQAPAAPPATPAVAPAVLPAGPTQSVVVPATPAPEAEPGLHYITSPIVGTFYRAPNPNAPMYVQVGDLIRPGQTLCIVEAMKLMNEIESDVAGEVVRILVENGQPVEYGERLFAVRVG